MTHGFLSPSAFPERTLPKRTRLSDLSCVALRGFSLAGEKRVYTTTVGRWDPSFLGLSPDPEVYHFPGKTIDTEYDRAKVPPYNGNDPPPAPGSLKRSLFPTLLNEVQNKGTQGVRARYGAELPPIISIVRHPGRPVILGMETREKGIHHRSRKKGIHHRASDPEKKKRRVSTVVVYTFFFPAKGIFAKGILGCTGFSPLLWEKGSEAPSCDGKKGLRLPHSSCSDIGNEGVTDPVPHRKRESQRLRPFSPPQRGKPRTSQNPLSENPLSATHDRCGVH